MGRLTVLEQIAQDIAAEFPEKNYLIFDVSVDRDVVTEGNMMGINYYSNQAAFLSGTLAAKMLESGDAKIDASQKVLGFVGSMDAANINDFLVGYLEGVKYVDPEIKVVTSYVGSFEDVSKCMEMTTQLYNQGAQIVYAPASQSILGAVTAAQKSDKYLIACDQDLYGELKESDPELAANVLSSSLKNVGESIYTSIKDWKEGTKTLDQDYILGLDSGAVGLAKNDNYKAIVPEEIQKFIEETEQKIIGGEITVGTAFDMTTEEAQITNSTSVMLTTVAGDEYAIGYVSLGSLDDSVKAVKIDGAEATAENIKRVGGNKKGVFTRDRSPKMAAHFLKERWEGIS